MIGRSHHRPDRGVLELHFSCLRREFPEDARLDIALDRQVMRRRLQILVMVSMSTSCARRSHHGEDFVVGLAKADHQARFGRNVLCFP
jgi:hypothetical protein